MKHPFEYLSETSHPRLYAVFFVLTAALAGLLTWTGKPFASRVGEDGIGYDIIDFEFMFTSERAQAILDAWGDEGVRAAM